MRMSTSRRTLPVAGRAVQASRNADGVLQLWADDEGAFAAGLGYAHAHDRQVQMMLVRLVGQGRLGECLRADGETLMIDTFARDMGFARDAADDVATCDPEVLRFAEAYAEGVNAFLAGSRRPLEFLLVGYRPEPWTVADTLVTIKLMTYVGLAQTQQDFEKLLIQSIRAGVRLDLLKKLVSPHLDGLEPAIVETLGKLKYVQSMLPQEVRIQPMIPTVSASNNWAVAGTRTATGTPICCSDPHLEVNRLPAVWYEVVAHLPDDERIGITMPGVPGLIMGRTRDIAFGFTYGFMDMVDYFVEDIREGRCRRGTEFVPLQIRQEVIRRKGKDPVTLTILESDLGVLETDPTEAELADGYYLTRAWSAQRHGAAPSLESIYRLPAARSVPDAQLVLRDVTISCNWVIADRAGNIGYQQSGRLPNRRHSGLHPVPAWDDALVWHGWVPSRELHSVINPECGYVATANEGINPPGGPLAVNLPMGSYRADRIRSVLAATDPIGVDDMKKLQLDLHSLHAERLMKRIVPLLPDVPAAQLLRRWDLRYDVDSRGATLFEGVYRALLRRVFGEGLFGGDAWDALTESTSTLADYYHLFDNVLLGDDPIWFEPAGRDEVFEEVLREVLTATEPGSVPRWGDRQRVMMNNIFFAGALPRWLGFDWGPLELAGNRATVVQGQTFSLAGRATTFAPSWRMVTDLGTDEAHTSLPGGPSGRRFSRYYLTGLKRWVNGEYKVLEPTR